MFITQILENHDIQFEIANQEKHMDYLNLLNRPLNEVDLLQSIWDEISFRRFREIANYLGWDVQNLKYPVSEFFKRIFHRFSNSNRYNMRLDRYRMFLEIPETFDMLLNGMRLHAKNYSGNNLIQSEYTRKLMPWMYS